MTTVQRPQGTTEHPGLPERTSNIPTAPSSRPDSIDCSACCTSVLDTAWNYLSYAFNWIVSLFSSANTTPSSQVPLQSSSFRLEQIRNGCIENTEIAEGFFTFAINIPENLAPTYQRIKDACKKICDDHNLPFNEQQFSSLQDQIEEKIPSTPLPSPQKINLIVSYDALAQTCLSSIVYVKNYNSLECIANSDGVSSQLLKESFVNGWKISSIENHEGLIRYTDLKKLAPSNQENIDRFSRALKKSLTKFGHATPEQSAQPIIDLVTNSETKHVSIFRGTRQRLHIGTDETCTLESTDRTYNYLTVQITFREPTLMAQGREFAENWSVERTRGLLYVDENRRMPQLKVQITMRTNS